MTMMNSMLLSYIFCGLLLNTLFELRFYDERGKHPILDRISTILFLRILWPIGLILMFIKHLQGRADFR